MTTSQARSPLASQIEKLLNESSSSDESPNLHKSISPKTLKQSKSSKRFAESHSAGFSKFKSKPEKLNLTLRSHQSPSKGLKSPESSKMLNSSRTKSAGNKSVLKMNQSVDELTYPISCQQEKYLLRIRIGELEKGLGKQSKKVDKLYDRVVEKRDEVKVLTDQLLESKKKDLVVLELKETINALEQNEQLLVEEIDEQQRISRSTIQKLHDLQEEWSLETQRVRRRYEEDANRQLDQQKYHYEDKLRRLEEENWKLTARIRDMEAADELEKSRQTTAVNNENAMLRGLLSERDFDNDRMRGELRELKQAKLQVEKDAAHEVNNLLNSLEGLREQIKHLKRNEGEITSQETHEKNQLRRKIDALQDELDKKNRTLREKDLEYKAHLESITKKVTTLQDELRRLNEYESKIDELEKAISIKDNELDLTKSYYKEELESRKVAQDRQKRDWADTYNDLLNEIKVLKDEVHSHKSGFSSSKKSRDRRDYY